MSFLCRRDIFMILVAINEENVPSDNNAQFRNAGAIPNLFSRKAFTQTEEASVFGAW